MAGLAVACAVVGCSADSEDGAAEREAREKRGAANSAFESDLAWLDRTYANCMNQLAENGRCVIPPSEETGMQPLTIQGPKLRTLDLRDRLRQARERAAAFSQAVGLAARSGACQLLAPLAESQNPYVYMGTSVSASAIVGGSANVDIVFDLRRRQAAVFTGTAVTVGTQIGVGASGYVGMAFGRCDDPNDPNPNLVDAWGTPNCSAGVSISTPFDLLSVDVTAVTTANGCMQGGTIGAGIGWSPDPLPIEGGVSIPVPGVGGPWDAATSAMARTGWGSKTVECNLAPDGSCPDGNKYVQFGSARAMALHMISQMGVAGVVPAATVLALDQMERRGLTIEQMCPSEVEAARTRRTPPEAIQALCNPALLFPDGGTTPPGDPGTTPTTDGGTGGDAGEEPKTPCSAKENDDYCGHEIGWASAKTRVNCRDGVVAATWECENYCKREFGYAYCY